MMTSDEPVEKLQKQLYCLNMATPGSQSHPVAPATPVEPKDTSANMTGEITAHARWLQAIQASGNSPEDWLQFTEFMRCNAKFKDDTLCLTFLSRLYAKAIRGIPNNLAKDNVSYIHLLINFAKLKCLNSAEEAREMFSHARHFGRSLALPYVASAQFEVSQGNRSKALRLLQKGRDVDAQPGELLDSAVRSLKAGQAGLEHPQSSIGDVRDNASGQNKENVYNVTDHPISYQSGYNKDEHYQPPGQVVSNTSSSLKKAASVCPATQPGSSSATVPNERPAKTTDHSVGLGLKLFRIPSPTALTPVSQPADSTSDARALLQPRFKHGLTMPTPQHPHLLSLTPASSTRTTTSKRAEVHYDDGTVSFSSAKKVSRGVFPDTSGNQDMGLLPSDLSHDGHTTLRSCHSTSDCKTPSLLSSSKKFKRFTGKPMRVLKRTSLTQLTEGEKDSDDDDDDDDDNYFYMKPLPEDTPRPKKKTVALPQPCAKTEDDVSFADRSTALLRPQLWEPTDQYKPATDESDHSKPATDKYNAATDKHSRPATDQSDTSPVVVDKCHNEAVTDSSASKQSSAMSNTGSNVGSDANIPKTKRFVGKPLRIAKSALTCQVTHSDGGYSDAGDGDDNDSGVMVSQGCQHATPKPQQAVVPTQPPIAMPSFPVPPSASQGHMGAPLQVINVNGNLYTKLKVIGRGGSCKVYLVLDCKHNLRALKCVDLEGTDEVTVAGYRNEIALLQRLQHSTRWVIKLYDFEYHKDTNQLHVVLEHGDTDMSTFFQRHAKDRSMTSEVIRFYWTQMLNAVGVLHREGIIHLDLKPANFLLVAGDVKLIDFGIASAIQQERTSVTRDQQIGTVNYMSPEAIVDTCGGSRTDASGNIRPHIKIGMKSDVWSLGCILYSLVYGHTPFQHITNFIAKMQAIINPNHAIEFANITDPNLLDVLKRCLTRDPKQRPSVEELLRHPYVEK